jgi:hypothetical protein
MDEKQQAIVIINQFLDWFNYHKFVVDENLRKQIQDFIGG